MYSKLESLRGVAACLVLLFHSHFIVGTKSLDFVKNSYLFVDFFFILSGFVLTLAYADKIRQGLAFREYISLRLGRIYPLHLFMLLVWVPYILGKQYFISAGYGGVDQFEHNNAYSFVSNLFLVHAMGVHDYLSWNHPSWSISVEFFTYIAFFILLLTLDRSGSRIFPLLIIIPGYAFLFSVNPAGQMDGTYDYGFIRCMSAFYCGVLLYRWKDEIAQGLARFNIHALEIIAVALTVAAVCLAHRGDGYLAMTLASFCLLLMVFASPIHGLVGRLLDTAPLRSIGLWSYSIYMTHDIILSFFSNLYEIVFKTAPKNLGVWAVLINIALILLTVLISRFTYLYVEKYFRDKVKGLVSRKTDELPVRTPVGDEAVLPPSK